MTVEDRPLEIIRKACPLPAPAQSAEPPNFRGFRPFCQFRRNPLEGVLGAHSNIARRNHHNRLLRRIRQRIDFVPSIHRQRPSAKQKKRHIRAQSRRNLHQSRQRHLRSRQSQHADHRRSRVARSAAHSARHRNFLFQMRAHVLREIRSPAASPSPRAPQDSPDPATPHRSKSNVK